MTITVYVTSDTEARVVFSGEENVYELGDSYPETEMHVHRRAPYWYDAGGQQLFGGYGATGPALMADTAADLPCDVLIDERKDATATRQIATGLSEAGRRALAEFLAENLNDKALRTLVSAWEQDVTFDVADCTAGHLEIGSHHSRTGNPVGWLFDADDVILEDVEVEEDGDAHLTASTDGDWRVVSDGTLAVRVDFTHREFAVEYRVLGLDDDDPRSQWTATPFQGAEFGLDAEGAWRRVAAWVENS